jgi:hypothetical protein
MGESYENIIRVWAYSEKGKKQLLEFKNKFIIAKTIVDKIIKSGNTYKLDNLAILKERMITGLYIVQYRKCNQNNMLHLFTISEAYGFEFSDLKQLEEYLLKNELADLELGNYLSESFLKEEDLELFTLFTGYGINILLSDNICQIDTDNYFSLESFFYGQYQEDWLLKLSLIYPDLHFSSETIPSMDWEYVTEVINGKIINHRKFTKQEIGW